MKHSKTADFFGSRKEQSKAQKRCDAPGCGDAGDYKAPKSQAALDEYYWFCLDHVREYNAAWDFFGNLTEEEMEQQILMDTIGQRPTWPIGIKSARKFEKVMMENVHDPFGFFREAAKKEHIYHINGSIISAEQRRACETLSLTPPLTPKKLKDQYKVMAKKYHPDANGGDKKAEEKLKFINEAYTLLKKAFDSSKAS